MRRILRWTGTRRAAFTAAIAAAALGTSPTTTSSASAHHSYSAFDLERLVEIPGVLEEFEWVSPHTVFMVRSDEGRLYRGEWRAPIAMQRIGFTKDTVHLGDRIVLVGNPKRDFDESRVMNVKSVRRPSDGGQWPAP